MRKIFLIAFVALIIILIGLLVIFRKSIPYLSTASPNIATSSAQPTPYPGSGKEIAGIVKSYRNDILEKKIVVTTSSIDKAFEITPSTVIYQCSDFNNINSCQTTDKNLKMGSEVKVFSKGIYSMFIIYK